jgi:hypothetical protein
MVIPWAPQTCLLVETETVVTSKSARQKNEYFHIELNY